MARHEVVFQVPWRGVGKEDIIFKVYRDGELHGTLKISKGALVWKGRNKKNGLLLDWERFDRIMKAEGREGPF